MRGDLQEKRLTLAIAHAAREALRRDHRVVLTRAGDLTVPLADRRATAARARADLFVSIHVNASTSSRAAGVEVFVGRPAETRSFVLAVSILRAILARFPERPSRGIKQRGLGVLRQPRPAVLVECFFLSNPSERAILSRPARRITIGRAIASGCEAFLKGPVPEAGAAAFRLPTQGAAERRPRSRR